MNWPVRFENGVCACSRACLSVACRLAGPFNISEKLNEHFRWFIDQLHSDKHTIVNKPDIYLRPKNYKRKPTSSRISNKKLEWRTKQMDQWKLNLWRRMASCRTLQTGHSLMSSIISKLQDLMSRLLLSRTRKSMASLCS